MLEVPRDKNEVLVPNILQFLTDSGQLLQAFYTLHSDHWIEHISYMMCEHKTNAVLTWGFSSIHCLKIKI